MQYEETPAIDYQAPQPVQYQAPPQVQYQERELVQYNQRLPITFKRENPSRLVLSQELRQYTRPYTRQSAQEMLNQRRKRVRNQLADSTRMNAVTFEQVPAISAGASKVPAIAPAAPVPALNAPQPLLALPAPSVRSKRKTATVVLPALPTTDKTVAILQPKETVLATRRPPQAISPPSPIPAIRNKDVKYMRPAPLATELKAPRESKVPKIDHPDYIDENDENMSGSGMRKRIGQHLCKRFLEPIKGKAPITLKCGKWKQL
jgi:hypothetical protein